MGILDTRSEAKPLRRRETMRRVAYQEKWASSEFDRHLGAHVPRTDAHQFELEVRISDGPTNELTHDIGRKFRRARIRRHHAHDSPRGRKIEADQGPAEVRPGNEVYWARALSEKLIKVGCEIGRCKSCKRSRTFHFNRQRLSYGAICTVACKHVVESFAPLHAVVGANCENSGFASGDRVDDVMAEAHRSAQRRKTFIQHPLELVLGNIQCPRGTRPLPHRELFGTTLIRQLTELHACKGVGPGYPTQLVSRRRRSRHRFKQSHLT